MNIPPSVQSHPQALRLLLTIVVFTVLSAFTCGAATFYVSSSDPNASDSYTTPTAALPWKTIAKLNATTFHAGDFIYLKSGDTWREMLTVASNGSSTAPITFTSYGSGALPVISGADLVTGWTPASGATANTYQAALTGTTSMVTSDSTYLKRGGSATTLAANQYYWSANILYINIGGDPSTHVIEAGRRNFAVYSKYAKPNHYDYITLFGLRLEKTNLSNVAISTVTHWKLQGCDFFFGNSNSSYAGGGVHSDNSDYTTVTGCHVNYALGDGIMIWRSINAVVTDNVIENVLDDGGNSGADGIQIGADVTTPTACNNFQILNNSVTRPSNATHKGCIIAEMGDNGIISGNVCSKGTFGVTLAGNNGTISYNYVNGTGNGGGIRISQDEDIDGMRIFYNVVANSPGFSGIFITNDLRDGGPPVVNRTNFLVCNNVVYNTYYGIVDDQPFSGQVYNNISWSDIHTSPRSRFSVASIVTGGTLAVNNNIWQKKGTDSYLAVSGTGYSSLAAWQTATGYDSNSTTADPLWVNPAAYDFHLQAGSPAIDTAANLGFTEDLDGLPVPRGSGPDMGAYEFQGLYAYEGFNYTSGTSLNGANGGTGWASPWVMSGSAGSAAVINGSFAYTGLPVTGNSFQIYDTDGVNQQVTRTFSRTFGAYPETYWISFLAKKLSTGREAHVNFGGLGFRAYQGNAWDVKTPTTTNTTITGATSSTLHLFLVRVDAGATSDTVRVWIDPVIASGEPASGTALVTLTDTAGFSFNTLNITHGPFGNSSQCGQYDEFRLGSSFSSVVTGP